MSEDNKVTNFLSQGMSWCSDNRDKLSLGLGILMGAGAIVGYNALFNSDASPNGGISLSDSISNIKGMFDDANNAYQLDVNFDLDKAIDDFSDSVTSPWGNFVGISDYQIGSNVTWDGIKGTLDLEDTFSFDPNAIPTINALEASYQNQDLTQQVSDMITSFDMSAVTSENYLGDALSFTDTDVQYKMGANFNFNFNTPSIPSFTTDGGNHIWGEAEEALDMLGIDQNNERLDNLSLILAESNGYDNPHVYDGAGLVVPTGITAELLDNYEGDLEDFYWAGANSGYQFIASNANPDNTWTDDNGNSWTSQCGRYLQIDSEPTVRDVNELAFLSGPEAPGVTMPAESYNIIATEETPIPEVQLEATVQKAAYVMDTEKTVQEYSTGALSETSPNTPPDGWRDRTLF
ncbi:MAG: hypothetical protein KAQ83_01315 [Nanoarchaeota archaeon]|nr:hypothetical protein [Nanoarchaeota archaeon]